MKQNPTLWEKIAASIHRSAVFKRQTADQILLPHEQHKVARA